MEREAAEPQRSREVWCALLHVGQSAWDSFNAQMKDWATPRGKGAIFSPAFTGQDRRPLMFGFIVSKQKVRSTPEEKKRKCSPHRGMLQLSLSEVLQINSNGDNSSINGDRKI